MANAILTDIQSFLSKNMYPNLSRRKDAGGKNQVLFTFSKGVEELVTYECSDHEFDAWWKHAVGYMNAAPAPSIVAKQDSEC